jgi:hypothetical protein
MQRRFRWVQVATLILASVLMGLTVAQAIRDRSWQPIWGIGWLPAVLVASLGTGRARGRCWPRSRRRSES